MRKPAVYMPHPLDLYNHLKNVDPGLAEKLSFYACADLVGHIHYMNREGMVSSEVAPALTDKE